MTDTLKTMQTCRRDTAADDFGVLFAQLAKPATQAPLDAGLVSLVTKINTPQFRRVHPTRR